MLIGREVELRQLGAPLADGRPVAVFGEAGVGKTALVREAAVQAGVALRDAGALATLAWRPYFPLSRALGREPEGGDAAYVAQEVESALRGEALFLDDLQWADAQTRELVRFLAGRVPIAAAVRHADPGTAGLRGALEALDFVCLDLQPLAEGHARELVTALRPGLSAPVIERVVERAAGLPLLLEELSFTREPSESLERSLAARARALPEEARHALALLTLAAKPLPRAALPHADLVAALDFIREEHGALEFRHPFWPRPSSRAFRTRIAAISIGTSPSSRTIRAKRRGTSRPPAITRMRTVSRLPRPNRRRFRARSLRISSSRRRSRRARTPTCSASGRRER